MDDGLNNAASISTPSALLYLTNSGAAIGIDAHFSLNAVTARAGAFAGLIHSSGAIVAVSPTYANVPLAERAKTEGLTSRPSSTCTRPSRPSIAIALLNPRAMFTARD